MDYKILEEAKRMCKYYAKLEYDHHMVRVECNVGCPARYYDYGGRVRCKVSPYDDNFSPAKAAEIIEKWAAEHPVKTYADVFFEAFPDAQRGLDGVTPTTPLCHILKMKCPDIGGCAQCWQQPYPERRDEK